MLRVLRWKLTSAIRAATANQVSRMARWPSTGLVENPAAVPRLVQQQHPGIVRQRQRQRHVQLLPRPTTEPEKHDSCS
ncbi:hypothetical protein [Saccharothrix xinjiangensis]|uniref:hypothetical protein n=1 Tax=Saccharothrix xinjiangensis TaxID=204798 RepID=UPI0031CED951